MKQVYACKYACKHLFSAPLLHRCVVLFATMKASRASPATCPACSLFLMHALWPAEIDSGISSSTDRICQQQLQKEQCEELGPNISLLADELQKQWHDRHNMLLGNVLIRPGSSRKVWWSCEQCPEGVNNVQRAFLISGRLLLPAGRMGGAVPSAQAGLFVSTTRLPERHLKLRCFGMPRRTIHCHQTS